MGYRVREGQRGDMRGLNRIRPTCVTERAVECFVVNPRTCGKFEKMGHRLSDLCGGGQAQKAAGQPPPLISAPPLHVKVRWMDVAWSTTEISGQRTVTTT